MSSRLPTVLAQSFRGLSFREGMQAEASRLRDLVLTADKAQKGGEPETQGLREGPQETPSGGQEECSGTLGLPARGEPFPGWAILPTTAHSPGAPPLEEAFLVTRKCSTLA